jgi:ABC-type nitrate/sulfonate/bicarbonate transport system substrate-binding protein
MDRVKSALSALATAALLCVGTASAQTVLRIGHSQAAEEPLWLMDTPLGITPNKGKVYQLTLLPFRGANDRMKAFEAGALECSTAAAVTIIYAASQGVPVKAVAGIARETSRSPSLAAFYVLEGSGINTVPDLRNKVLALTGFKSGTEVWVRAALQKAGLNADRDVKYKVVGFPQMGDALRAKQIDLAMLVDPWLGSEKKKGGVKLLFDSRYGMPFDEDLQTLFCSESFLAKNREVVRAFVSDLAATIKFYLANMKEARAALVKARKVVIDLNDYLALPDYDREPNGRLDPASWAKLQEIMLSTGFQEKKIDTNALIVTDLLPK